MARALSSGKPALARGAGRMTPLSVALTVAGILIIGVSMWFLPAYLEGQDPLSALFGGGPSGPSGSADAEAVAAGANQRQRFASLSKEDVIQALAGLSYGGEDLSLVMDDAGVYLDENGIWIEQVSLDSAPTMLDVTARRTEALAVWAKGMGLDIPQVTWIVEDGDGTVRMSETVSARTTAGEHTTAGLLGATLGYQISGDAYQNLGAVSFSQAYGVSPKLPDGANVSVSSETTSAGEQLLEDRMHHGQ